MVTRHGRSKPFARLRCDALEPRVAPAAAPVIDFGAGFTAAGLPGGLPAGYADGNLLLTDGPFQARTVWAPTPVDLRAFQTSFVFRLDGDPGRLGDGFTFALAGAIPAVPGAAGGALGYQGLTDSVAIKFDLVDNAGEGGDSVGIFTGGAEPTAPAVSLDGTPINLNAQHPIRADVGYDAATRTLTVALTDTTAPDRTWTHQFAVDIPGAVGSPTGYAGFTAGTGELFARQAIDSWTLTEGSPGGVGNRPPEIVAPAAASWLGPSGVALGGGATDDGGPDNLTYSWEVVSAPPGVPPEITLAPRDPGPGSAVLPLDAHVRLAGGGAFVFRVTVRDAEGLTATSEVRFVDPLSVPSFEVAPQGATVPAGGTIQFQTLVPDGSGNQAPERIATSWEVVSGRGSVDGLGRYTAQTDASGPVTVQATVPALVNGHFFFRTGDATVTVVPTQRPAGPVDLSGGFAGAGLAGNGSAQVAGDRLRLADGPFQAGSAYAPGPVDVRGFTTSFRFQVGDAPSWEYGDGLTFVLQNAGPAAVGAAGGGLGYAGIEKSMAVKFDLVDNAGEGTDSVGVFTGGAEPTTPADRLPPGQDGAIHLNSGHIFQADVAYADGTLRVELWDTETGQGFRRSYAVDIQTAVGGPTAYAGFTAGTGSLFAPIDVLDWTYAPTQEWGPGPTDGGDGAPSLTVHAGVGAGTIATVAGTGTGGYGGDGGPAASAPLYLPDGVAVDGAGNLYIADSVNQRVRRVDAATGLITTVAGTGTAGYGGDGGPATNAALWHPMALAVDAAGNLFIADDGNSRIRRVDAATGIITTVAGNGTPGYGGDGGPATAAALDDPFGVAVDPTGNVFIADRNNNRVRKVDAATEIITTVAGTGAQGFGGDGGPAASATLFLPAGVTVDPAGNVYIADAFNDRIRRVDTVTGVITTVVGNGISGFGGDGGPATAAAIDYPFGMTVDAAGNLFFADNGNHRVRRVDAATGVITTVAGIGTAGDGGDGGPGTSAALDFPSAVAVDAAGNLYVADEFNSRVRRVAAPVREGDPATYTFTITNTSPAGTDPVTVTGMTDTVLGDLTAVAEAAHGGGPLVLAPNQGFTFNYTTAPLNAGAAVGTVTVTGHDDEGLPATASDGHTLTVADVAPAIAVDAAVGAAPGLITTVAGNGTYGYGGDGGPATAAALLGPGGVAEDAAGNLFIADTWNARVRRVDAATGLITTVAGTGNWGYAGDGGPATNASLAFPRSVALDAAGNLFIADANNNRVRRVDAATGIITTVAGTGVAGYGGDGGPAASASLSLPYEVTVDAAGNLFIADDGRVRRVDAATGIITTVAGNGTIGYSGDGGPATGAAMWGPGGVAVDAAGNLFIAELGGARVRRVDAATGVITTVAGTGVSGYGGDGGPATGAALNNPYDVAVDAAGNLFIADKYNNRVRRVDAATGVITTVAGTGEQRYGGDDGPAADAALYYPQGVAVDAAGTLLIADSDNNRIRKMATGSLQEGGPVTYTFTITNASPASTDPVTVTSVADTLLGDLTAAAAAANGGNPIVLAPGGRFTFSATGPARNAGTVVSTVTVTAHDDEGTIATASDGVTAT